MDESKNQKVSATQGDELKEDLSKHFENKKNLPLRKKNKNIFLRLGITLFVISVVLIIVVFLVYFFFIREKDNTEENTVEKQEEVVEETTNNEKVDKDIYENQDEDKDGLTTIQELELGTKVDEIDSDYDGIPDGWEVIYNLDPLEYNDALEDGDEDKLTNIEEYKYQTDPGNPDTDKDGYEDGDEVGKGFNPNGKGKLKDNTSANK
ncbi:MAG: hypothetical protein HQ538_00110 [Parcubacteria group bacterium]|nr:hypothetical protein [Parcubacteria group bacterium]